MIVVVIAILIACFGVVSYKNGGKQFLKNSFGISEFILISASVSYVLYLLFFKYADYIHSFNLKYPTMDFIPPVRAPSREFDGVEGYTLYALIFATIFLSLSIVRILSSVKNKTVFLVSFIAFAILSLLYFWNVGFIPSMSNLNDYRRTTLFIPFLFLIVTGLLYILQKYVSNKVFLGVLALLLIPVCFVATDPMSIADYSYILSPSLRLLNGVPLQEIYFQYDLFLSLIGALWMKLNLDLKLFQAIGQLSYYLLFIGAFIFSKKFFTNKNLALFLLIAIVVTRLYANMLDASSIFQVTPLRLELWFVLLLLAYYKGAYHWLVAITLGLLLMLHRNFGLIYFICYIQFLLTLFVVDIVGTDKANRSVSTYLNLLKKHLLLSWKNILIIAVFVVVSIFMFKGFIPESALLYQKIGVGMIQVSPKSFYWYVPVLFSVTFILLFVFKNKLSETYFNTSLLLLFFSIGNSLYFLGRSHEHNMLNLATSFVFVAFLMFDLLENKVQFIAEEVNPKQKKSAPQTDSQPLFLKFQTYAIAALPVLFIALSAYYYSEKTSSKLKTQISNLKKSQFLYPIQQPYDVSALKRITNNSNNVYFLNFGQDFLYYYYGNYKPEGYFSPCATWLLKKDLLNFVQDLLEKKYYVVTSDARGILELLPELKYNKVVSEGPYTALSKDSVELLLPEKAGTLAHIGINSNLEKNGIYLPPVTLGANFTLELLLKPNAQQVPDANVLVNAQTDSIGPGGFSFQQNGATTNQYVFGYAGGKSWINPPIFALRPNEWNYVVIAVSDNKVTVFNNGTEAASQKTDFTIKNVSAPVIISNGMDRQNQFNGLIREVKIMNDTISLQSIKQNFEIVKAKLM